MIRRTTTKISTSTTAMATLAICRVLKSEIYDLMSAIIACLD